LKYKDGSEYSGEWYNHLRHGKGIYKWANGAVYDGEWSAGERHGVGKMKYDGSEYSGEWLNGKEHIKGVREPQGVIAKVIWYDLIECILGFIFNIFLAICLVAFAIII
jgi:hypothetical protein